jgi:hypothetical protein
VDGTLEECEGWGKGYTGWSWVLYLWEELGENWENEEKQLACELDILVSHKDSDSVLEGWSCANRNNYPWK